MHSRKEKNGLPPALNGVADSDLQVSGAREGQGGHSWGLAFKIIFLSPAGLS